MMPAQAKLTVQKLRNFDQNDHLGLNDPGVCNALVLEWLSPYNPGEFLASFKRTFKRAKITHDQMNSAMFQQYGLTITQLADTCTSKLGTVKLLKEIRGWQNADRMLIGFSAPGGAGHAIGLKRVTGTSTYVLFDPNEGYWRVENDPQFVFLFGHLDKGFNTYAEVDIWGCS